MPRAGGAAAYRLAHQAGIGVAPNAVPAGPVGRGFHAFHDREEVGPTMLARIVRQTGLTPEDL